MADAPLDYDTYRRTFEQVPDDQLPTVLQRFQAAVSGYNPFDGGMSMTPSWLVRKKILGGFGKLLGAPPAQQRSMFTQTLNENDKPFRTIFSHNLPLFQSFYSTLPKPPVTPPPVAPPAPVASQPASASMVKPGSFADSLDTGLLTNYLKPLEPMSKIAALAEPAVPTTGPAAIAYALKNLDVDRLEQEAQKVIKSKKVSKRSNAVSILNAVQGLRRNGHTPSDLMISRVPVIPPQFRPFTVIGDSFTPGDANELYRDLFKVRDAYNESRKELGEAGSNDARLHLYDAVKSLYGYAEPVEPKTAARGVSGFLKKVTGMSPKTSFLHRKMLSKTQDNVGRGVITVDPELGLDEVGVPREMAWKIFAPYIQSHMVQKGMAPSDSVRSIRDRTAEAARALDEVVKNRPVMYSRAPAWHKFSALGGYAKLIDGEAIKINPLTTSGANADFNGDQQVGRVLVLVPKAKKTKNLFSILTLPVADSTVKAMISKNVIPAFNHKTHALFLTDLADFPRGDLRRHKPDGKNGVIDFYSVPEGLLVTAFDEATGSPVWAPVAFYSVHSQRLVEIVDLSNGRQIVTDDDPRAVYGIDPADPTMKLSRFSPRAALACRAVVPVVKDVAEACQKLECLSEIPVGEKNVKLDWNFGYLLGALAGDGWWDKKTYNDRWHVYLADLKGQVAARCYGILKGLYGAVSWYQLAQTKAEDSSRYGDSVRHTFTLAEGQQLSKFLSQWLGGGATANSTGSGSKTLPDFFMLAPKEFRLGVLAGLVDTDGSVSVSNAKNRPQLLCAVTSTSFRLICDARFLCLTLGLQASVSYSKTTIRGNTSWICTISAPGAKRIGAFSNLATDSKRNAFINTEVCDDNTSQVYDKVPVSAEVQRRVAADVPRPKIRAHERAAEVPTAGLESRKEAQNFYTQWSNVRKDGLVSRSFAKRLIVYLDQLQATAENNRQLAIVDLQRLDDSASPERVQLWREAIRSTCPFEDTPARYKAGKKIYACLNRPLKVGRCTPRLRQAVMGWLRDTAPYQNAGRSAEFKQWGSRFVANEAMAWTRVIAVQKTGIREDGYDLTVPGYDTFMSADGIILSNTMQLHVPSSDEAVADVRDRIMPSKMLFSDRNYDMIPASPKHEHILGLFAAQQRSSKNSYKFPNEAEAVAAIKNGTVKLSDEVEIGNKRQTPLKF